MIIAVVIDRVIKIQVQGYFELHESIAVIPNAFYLTYILNPGAAFGLLAGKTGVFIATAILVVAGIVYAQFKVPREEKFVRLALGMIGGGALGNLYDRAVYGSVIDYLDIRIWSFIFNFADTMIVLGVGIMLIYVYRQEQNSRRPENE